MEPFETIEYRHHTIKLYYDEHPHDTPRDWDNLGNMYCFHNRYILGDPHEMTVEGLQKLVSAPFVLSLPLFLYDHSGIAMSTSRGYPFDCPWDSGQVGYIWVFKDKIRKEFNVKYVTEKVRAKAMAALEGEVVIYDQHLRGEVYGYVIEDENGDHVESCWGYYGDPEEFIMPEAKGIVDHITDEQVGLIY